MSLRSLALGLGIGFLLGWIVSGMLRPAADVSLPSRPATTSSPNVPAPSPSPTAEQSSSSSPTPVAPSSPRLPGVQELTTRMEKALAAGDRQAYFGALRRLVRLDAETELLAVMRDEKLPAPLRGNSFLEALHDSDLPGIAAAARRRFEMNLEAGGDSWTSCTGWFSLVAIHGSEADLEWLASRNESGQIRIGAANALLSATTDHGLRFARRLLENGRLKLSGAVVGWAQYDVDEGFRIASAASRNVEPAADTRAPRPRDLLARWAGSIKSAEVPEFRDFLTSLHVPGHRLAAVYAVESLRERELDTSGFETLCIEPTLILEADDRKALYSTARYAIEYNEVTWTERAAAALEARGYTREAKKVRAGLTSPWNKRAPEGK